MSSKYRVMYLRDKNQQPVGCVAIGLTRTMKNVKYGISVLNPVDKFDRKTARLIALERLVNQPQSAVFIGNTDDISVHDVSISVMQNLSNNAHAPSRARRAAKRWLTE